MTFELSGKGYWNSTIKVCEAAISMLAACENQDIYLVDTALEHLQNLVRHGRTLENVKKYKPNTGQITSTTNVKKTSSRSNRPLQTNPNWTLLDETTVDVSLPDQSHIIAKTISNEEQLKALIPIIKKTGCFSMDCEFLALKKNQPRLKVLQIAVSKTEGYAIMVDHFQNIGTIRDVLGEVLADDSILRLGWAVRADAQAIENSVPGIHLGRILDLQSLVFDDAVGTLNLANAMNKYASSWEGLAEFQYAKEMGNSFSFTDSHCIWLQRPLPHQALVYAVFDVVSLFALYQQLTHLKIKDEYYWPTNVINKLSSKAYQKWQMNRIYIPPESARILISDEDVISLSDSYYSSASPVTINSGGSGGGNSSTGGSSFGSKSRMKARNDNVGPSSLSSPATNPDDEAAYLEDLERAKWLSLQDQVHQKSPYFSTGHHPTSQSRSGPASASASTSASPPSASTATATASLAPNSSNRQRNVVEVEEYSFDNISVDSADITSDNEGIKFATDVYEPSRKLDIAELPPDTWGEVDTNRMTPNGSWQAVTANSPSAPDIPTIPTPPLQPADTTIPATAIKMPPPPTAVATTTTTKVSPPTSTSSPGAKWNNTWNVTYTDRNTGSMVNSTPTNDEAGWRLFVEQSQSSWQKGVDSSMKDYDMKVKKITGSPLNNSNNTNGNNNNNSNNINNNNNNNTYSSGNNSPATGSPQPRRFNTIVGPTGFNQWSGGDGWETEEQQPDTMTMALTGFKTRKTHGPRVVNMYDFDVDDDTEDDSDSDEEDQRKHNGQASLTTTTTTTTKAAAAAAATGSAATGSAATATGSATATATATASSSSSSSSAKGIQNGTMGEDGLSTISSQNTIDMDTFRDYYYMDDNNNIALHAVNRLEQLNSLAIPSFMDDNGKPLMTISIAVQFHQSSWSKNLIAKGLSICTSDGHAYSIVLDRICSWTDSAQLLNSHLGRLLTDPRIRRISWRYPFFKDILNERLGFEIGHVVDISACLQPEEQKLPMMAVLETHIHDWPGLQQYKDAKADVDEKEKASSRKFSGSIWDRESLSEATLIFTAAQGAMLLTLDQAMDVNE